MKSLSFLNTERYEDWASARASGEVFYTIGTRTWTMVWADGVRGVFFLCKHHFDVLTFSNTYKFGTVRKHIAVAWNFWGLWRHQTPLDQIMPLKNFGGPRERQKTAENEGFFKFFFRQYQLHKSKR